MELKSKKCVHVECDRQLVDQGTWERLGKEGREAAIEENYRRHEGHGLCRKHRRMLPADEVPLETEEQQLLRLQITGMLEEMKDARDPVRATAIELDRSVEDVKRYLKRHGIAAPPAVDARVLEREYQIDEIRFLRSAGQGVAQIAAQFELTAQALVDRVHRWKLEGKVDFDFTDEWEAINRREPWASEEWKTPPQQAQRAWNRAA